VGRAAEVSQGIFGVPRGVLVSLAWTGVVLGIIGLLTLLGI
jgi:hypothetical protein